MTPQSTLHRHIARVVELFHQRRDLAAERAELRRSWFKLSRRIKAIDTEVSQLVSQERQRKVLPSASLRLCGLLLLTFLTGCVTNAERGTRNAELPPLPKPIVQHALPGEVFTVPAKEKTVRIEWDYPLPLPQPNLTFELFASSQPTVPFEFRQFASQPPIVLPADQPQQFFILRAYDYHTGLRSDWNR